MQIDHDLPRPSSPLESQQSPQQTSSPVMSQDAAQQGYQSASAQTEKYDSFFKSKVKSYRPHIIITALLQIGMYFLWPFIVATLLILLFGDEVLTMSTFYAPPEILAFIEILSWLSLLVSVALIILLIYFTTQDAKKNTGRNPTSTAIFIFFLGFLGAFIYLLITIKKQGKAAEKNNLKQAQTKQ